MSPTRNPVCCLLVSSWMVACGGAASPGADTCEVGECAQGTTCEQGRCSPPAPGIDAGQPDYCAPCVDETAATVLACPARRPETESELEAFCAGFLRTGRTSATVSVGECTIPSGLPLPLCNATSPDPSVDVLSVVSFPAGLDCHYARHT